MDSPMLYVKTYTILRLLFQRTAQTQSYRLIVSDSYSLIFLSSSRRNYAPHAHVRKQLLLMTISVSNAETIGVARDCTQLGRILHRCMMLLVLLLRVFIIVACRMFQAVSRKGENA